MGEIHALAAAQASAKLAPFSYDPGPLGDEQVEIEVQYCSIVPELKVGLFPLLFAQGSVSASPAGPPAVVAAMLDFCARHNIAAVTEEFPMSKANEALAHLEAGKARYRIVLKNDLQ